jgi:hypothetical protein
MTVGLRNGVDQRGEAGEDHRDYRCEIRTAVEKTLVMAMALMSRP